MSWGERVGSGGTLKMAKGFSGPLRQRLHSLFVLTFYRVIQSSDVLEATAEHEESSMSTQGQDRGPIAHNCHGERRTMRLVRELGESEWDNG